MSDLYRLTDGQMARLEPYFTKSHGKPRVDDRRVLSGIVFVNRNGLRLCDAPREYGPHNTLYNRWKRWGERGVFLHNGRACCRKRHTADDPLKAQWMLGDRGYDADWYRDALQTKDITPCIPGRKSRIIPVKHDKRRYQSRRRIEIIFGRLKDWRCVTTRYDRCPTVLLSAIALAATVIFWL